jgi:hypothetical protein
MSQTTNGIDHDEIIKCINKIKHFISFYSHRFSNLVSSSEDLFSEGILALIKYFPNAKKNANNKENYLARAAKLGIIEKAIETKYPTYVPFGSYYFLKERNGNPCYHRKTIDSLLTNKRTNIVRTTLCHVPDHVQIMEIEELIKKHDSLGVASPKNKRKN